MPVRRDAEEGTIAIARPNPLAPTGQREAQATTGAEFAQVTAAQAAFLVWGHPADSWVDWGKCGMRCYSGPVELGSLLLAMGGVSPAAAASADRRSADRRKACCS